jgi:uncharacterized protein YbjT (DUF2867 family)
VHRPDDVADLAVTLLIEDGHHGKIYRPTSDDTFTAAQLADVLAPVVGRDVRVADGGPGPGYFALVAAGAYVRTDNAAALLGRRPRSYAEWLAEHAPAITPPLTN